MSEGFSVCETVSVGTNAGGRGVESSEEIGAGAGNTFVVGICGEDDGCA